MFLYTLCLVCIGTLFSESNVNTVYKRTRGSGRYLDTKVAMRMRWPERVSRMRADRNAYRALFEKQENILLGSRHYIHNNIILNKM